MIRSLRISNLALIEDVTVEFREGFNVFTGETGAGKTIILQGLELLLGARGDSEKIRSGKERLEVEGLFNVPENSKVRELLEEQGLLDEEDGDQLLIRRVITAEGKSRCWINGRMCNVSTLSSAGEFLVDLHGQHEHQRLLRPVNHLEYLDGLGDAGHLALLREYQEAWRGWKRTVRELEELAAREKERDWRLEELRERIKEIESVSPRPGELEGLEDELRAARNREELFRLVSEASTLLEAEGVAGGAVDRVASARALLQKAAALDPRLGVQVMTLEEAWNGLLEAARELGRYLESMAHDPGEIEAMEGRVFALRELYRRYGGGWEEVRDALDEARRGLEELQSASGRLEELRGEAQRRERLMEEAGEKLSWSRRELAGLLEGEVNAELSELGMSGATFRVALESADRFTETGRDRVEMLISPASGEEAMPIAKIASGGELSRLMLALKMVLARADQVPTLVFDEVDSGIGGVTAGRIGEKLAGLSAYHQVVCVTHLPQIAACADVQFRIFRSEEGGRAVTRLEELQGEGRVEELARMLGGGGESASRHAQQLLRGGRRKGAGAARRGSRDCA